MSGDPEIKPMVRVYSDELLARVSAALEKTQGNRAHAAIIVGETHARIHNIIRHTPWLKAKWSLVPDSPVEPSEAADLDRPASSLGRNQKEIVNAITKQDEIVQSGMKSLGFSESQMGFIQALQTQYTGNLNRTLDLSYGGAVHSTMKMLTLMQEIEQRLAEVDASPEKFRKTAFTKGGDEYEVENEHDFRLKLYDRYTRVADLLRKMNTSLNEATKTRLLAEKLRKDIQAGNSGPATVAGWKSPVNITGA